MHVAHLSLADFRSWTTAELALDAGPSVLVGPNGQGKTNLVEALGYVATLGSHRVALDAPLVRAGAERAVVRSLVRRDGRELLVELEINPGRANRARLNRAPVPRPREVLGVLRTVLFAPEDLLLVRGEPDARRRFLDDLLVLRAPRYAAVRADYERVLKQRNALLKTAAAARRAGPSGDLRALDAWDTHLVRHGADLLAARLELVAALEPRVRAAYAAVAPSGGATSLAYRSSLPSEEPLLAGPDGVADRDVLAARFLAELARVRPQELERGVSLVGPHRDDLLLQLGDLPAKGYASHGESWSYALALRLGSFTLLREEGDDPVLVLDDVFAELDVSRRERLGALVADAEQVLVTAAVAADVPDALQGARYDVMGGELTRVR